MKDYSNSNKKLLRLAYIASFQNEKNKIYDNSAKLLRELATLYRIDVIKSDETLDIANNFIKSNFAIHNSTWFSANYGQYDRVFYYFGNSSSHRYMLDLLQIIPGVVFLHDFFLPLLQFSCNFSDDFSNAFAITLQKSHGYKAVYELFTADASNLTLTYPYNISVLQQALGIIVLNSQYKILADTWYGAGTSKNWYVIRNTQAYFWVEEYALAIEDIYSQLNQSLYGHVQSIVRQTSEQNNLSIEAKKLAKRFPPAPRLKQLLVDVSTLVHVDFRTGIQRVTRAILLELLLNPPKGWNVEPVYSPYDKDGYLYARCFTCDFLGIKQIWQKNECVEAWSNDIFFGLDLCLSTISAKKQVFHEWQDLGVKIYFTVYDILPLLQANMFPPEVELIFLRWLEFIIKFDGAICISRSVAAELNSYITQNNLNKNPTFTIKSFHLGADFKKSLPNKGLPDNYALCLQNIKLHPCFLVVSTIEPRKGHAQVFSAFELLWKQGQKLNLVFVGKEGWMMGSLVQRLRISAKLAKNFFWLEGISDEFLEKIYDAATCLIVASEGEGFGLSLIEAAQYGLPIIARDLPVFREVAGEYAYYFQGKTTKDLVQAILRWLELQKSDKISRSENMPKLTWKESTQQLLQAILP